MDTVLFDLGRVLLDWNPRYFYARFFPGDEAGLERFVTEVLSGAWIREMDAGKPAAIAIAERSRMFPQHAHLVARWTEGWPEMLPGPIDGSVELLARLRKRGHRLFALTNFSTETWPLARERFDFLDWFEHIVVSGELGITKPDPAIYRHAIARCRLEPEKTLFIDDLAANVEAARAIGFEAVLFSTPEQLAADLARFGFLDERDTTQVSPGNRR